MSTDAIDVDSVEVGVDDAPPAAVVTLPDRYEYDAEQAQMVEQMGPVAADEFKALAAQALVLSRANAVPGALRGKPHDLLLVLMSARDLGLAPTVAMRKMYIVDGQVTIAPALKMALVRMKGAGRVWFDPQNDDQEATAYGQRTGEDHVHAVTFTMEDAKRAGLASKHNWTAYPGRMLQWRAVGYLVDDLWPEIAFGMYTPDELGAYTDDEGHVIDAESVEVPEGFEVRSRKAKVPATVVAFKARLKDLPDDLRDKMEAWYQDKVWSNPADPVPWDDLPESWWPKVDGLLTKAEAKARDAQDAPEAPQEPRVACLGCGSVDPCDCTDQAVEAQREDEAVGEALGDDQSF